MVGTASLDWVLRVLGIELSAVEGLLGTSPPGANGLNVLPYLATSGERAPFVDPLAAGSISGLRLTTNRDDLVRAVCEGLAYTARHCFEAAGRSGRIVVAGGGSKSSNWMQMFADVLEVPLELARTPEVGARGAVLAGAEARGRAPRRRGSGPPRRVSWSPTTRTARVYDAGFEHQMELLEAARPLWHTRGGAGGRPEHEKVTPTLSPSTRNDALAAATAGTHDLVVVGGGVTGAGVALDAAARGLSVVLLEAGDLAVGTSSRSGKTMHGGLRYLEQLNFSLVFGALRERDLTIKTLAPAPGRPRALPLPAAAPVGEALRRQRRRPVRRDGHDEQADGRRPARPLPGPQGGPAGGARARPGRGHRRPAVPGRADGRRPAHPGRRPHRGRLRGARDHARPGDGRPHRRGRPGHRRDGRGRAERRELRRARPASS